MDNFYYTSPYIGNIMKVYGIFFGEYSDWNVEGFFTSKKEAEQFCVANNAKEGYHSNFYIQELKSMTLKNGVKDTKVLRHYTLVFDLREGEWKLREDPQRYQIYTGSKKETKFGIWSSNERIWYCDVTATTYNKAKKIAYDNLAFWKAQELL